MARKSFNNQNLPSVYRPHHLSRRQFMKSAIATSFIVGMPGLLVEATPAESQVVRNMSAVGLQKAVGMSSKLYTLPYNEVYGIATHNSYWINRSDQVDYFASGTQELISDQLLHEHVRALEIDVHSEGAAPGQWKVYHTSDSEDFLGRYLEDYLEYLRNFQYAVPQHDVINVIIELKNVVPWTGVSDLTSHVHYNFASDHTIEQFDDTFRRYLGPWLYTPADFLARKPDARTMTECARAAGWPTIDELRGKFMINIIGNWSTAAYDWVSYATSDLKKRVCFPIQSIFDATQYPKDKSRPWFSVTVDGSTFWIRDIDERANPSPDIDPVARQVAFDASVFWQLEDPFSFASEQATAFRNRGGVIRGRDAYDYPDQRDRLQNRIQMVQTDYPWHMLNDEAPSNLGIPTDPSRRLRDGSWLQGPPSTLPGAFREFGARFYAHTIPPTEIWAYTTVPAISQRWWEVTVSTTRHGDTWTENTHDGLILDDVPLSYPRRAQENGRGVIRAHSEDDLNTVVIVRHKETQPGASYYQEKVIVTVIVVKGGKEIAHLDLSAARYGPCLRDNDPNSSDVYSGCIGSLIALSVDNRARGSTVTAFSAGKTKADGTPDWQPLGQWNFEQPLIRQGFSGYADVLFAGPRTANTLNSQGLPAEPPHFVKIEYLPSRQVWEDPIPSSNAVFVDLSFPDSGASIDQTRMLTVAGADFTFVYVPAGEFTMGSPKGTGNSDEHPQSKLYLPAFWIGQTEVTNSQYAVFLKAGGYNQQDLWTKAGWQWRSDKKITQPYYWNDGKRNRPEYPVGINWYEASAYATWLTKQSGLQIRLPTEAEWEKAARGGMDGFIYPWGDNPPTDQLLNYNYHLGGTSKVGSYPAGMNLYGAFDMAGNVAEWTSTAWGGTGSIPGFAYPYRADDGRENADDQNWTSAKFRQVRGGSYGDNQDVVRIAKRTPVLAWIRSDYVGVRLVMVAP